MKLARPLPSTLRDIGRVDAGRAAAGVRRRAAIAGSQRRHRRAGGARRARRRRATAHRHEAQVRQHAVACQLVVQCFQEGRVERHHRLSNCRNSSSRACGGNSSSSAGVVQRLAQRMRADRKVFAVQGRRTGEHAEALAQQVQGEAVARIRCGWRCRAGSPDRSSRRRRAGSGPGSIPAVPPGDDCGVAPQAGQAGFDVMMNRSVKRCWPRRRLFSDTNFAASTFASLTGLLCRDSASSVSSRTVCNCRPMSLRIFLHDVVQHLAHAPRQGRARRASWRRSVRMERVLRPSASPSRVGEPPMVCVAPGCASTGTRGHRDSRQEQPITSLVKRRPEFGRPHAVGVDRPASRVPARMRESVPRSRCAAGRCAPRTSAARSPRPGAAH